jgi:hypothetical protein
MRSQIKITCEITQKMAVGQMIQVVTQTFIHAAAVNFLFRL